MPVKAKNLFDLDAFALGYAKNHPVNRIRGDNTIDQLNPLAAPDPGDLVPIWHIATGRTESAPASSFAGGGGGATFAFNSNLSALSIYNYGYYVNAPGGSAAANSTALTNMFTALNNNGGLQGGTGWIPQYSFAINASTGGYLVPDQTILEGLGLGGHQSGSAFHFVINETAGGGQTFLQTQQPHTSAGIYIRNLAFQWNNPTSVNDCCIDAETWNVRTQWCNFQDCPIAIQFGPGKSLGCTLEGATIQYGNVSSVPNNVTNIMLTGVWCGVIGPSEFFQKSISTGGPTGVACIGIGGGQQGSEHQYVHNVHISDYSYGIDFANVNNYSQMAGGAEYINIFDCEINSYNRCINLGTYTNATNFLAISITNNVLYKSQNSTNGDPIVWIDTNGGGNSNISAVDFIGNTIFSNVTYGNGHTGVAQANQYGIQINAGQGIRVIGGKIGNMGSGPTPSSDGTANICISGTGGPGSVTISGVGLGPNVPGAGGGATGAGPSAYAILVSATLTNGPVMVVDCDMTGTYGVAPVGVTGSVASGTFFVRNCAGYNDQNTSINTESHCTTGSYAAYNQGANTGTSYYGPSYIFYQANAGGGTLKINGLTALNLANGQTGFFWLNSPYDTFQFSAAPAHLQWIGK